MSNSTKQADSTERRAYNTGLISALLFFAALDIVTGLVLLPAFNANDPYGSVAAISRSGPLGFVRNLHHWSSALMLLLGEVYIVVGLFRGAYRKPGQWLWVSVIVLFLIGALMQLTGHLLPMDVHAVRTAVVETGIAQNAPVVGQTQADLLRGGSTVGQATFRLWYTSHVALLSVVLILLIAAIFAAARKRGIRLVKASWIAASSLVVFAMSIAARAPFGSAATASDFGSFATRPEWYVLPMHTLLNIFQGIRPTLGFVGSMVIPGIGLLLVLSMPWLDRSGRAAWPKGLAILVGAGLIALFIMGLHNVAPVVGEQIVAYTSGGDGPAQRLDPAMIAQGRDLFKKEGCGDCHRIKGVGDTIGPDLTDEGSRHGDPTWHIRHLKDPKAMTPGSTMPSYAKLKDNELAALAHYMASLRK
ncbi:MAG: ubiquinol-cytochrome c reductase cytochrome b subunit [Fimbriimonadaceae bacterium]|nr:ubiquinol-cytochrome c reductase cytochrome b subunit [Fimbriimonadaceae bacterium]